MTCAVENYEKGEVKELEDHVNMKCVLENAVRMNVNAGSKIHNLMKFAEKKMNVRIVYFHVLHLEQVINWAVVN